MRIFGVPYDVSKNGCKKKPGHAQREAEPRSTNSVERRASINKRRKDMQRMDRVQAVRREAAARTMAMLEQDASVIHSGNKTALGREKEREFS